MGAQAQLLVTFGIMVFALIIKWFTLRFVATEQLERLCRRRFGEVAEVARFMRMFRELGWECANAALGLMVVALVFEKSNLRFICENRGNYQFVFAISLFMAFLILYGLAIISRYIFLETAEKVRRRRLGWGFLVWMIGLLMLLNSSWFVVGVTNA